MAGGSETSQAGVLYHLQGGDMNGDGYDEVISQALAVHQGMQKQGAVRFSPTRVSGKPGWPKDTDKGMMSSASLRGA